MSLKRKPKKVSLLQRKAEYRSLLESIQKNTELTWRLAFAYSNVSFFLSTISLARQYQLTCESFVKRAEKGETLVAEILITDFLNLSRATLSLQIESAQEGDMFRVEFALLATQNSVSFSNFR